uniref:Uncharacterized protein n=1 Tax=Setaria italica TaxID=4555 RepID=K3XNG0_SETIT
MSAQPLCPELFCKRLQVASTDVFQHAISRYPTEHRAVNTQESKVIQLTLLSWLQSSLRNRTSRFCSDICWNFGRITLQGLHLQPRVPENYQVLFLFFHLGKRLKQRRDQ